MSRVFPLSFEEWIDEVAIVRHVMAKSCRKVTLVCFFLLVSSLVNILPPVPIIAENGVSEEYDILSREMWNHEDNGIELNDAQESALSSTNLARSADPSWSAAGGSEDRDFIYEMVETDDGSIIIAGSIFVDCWLGSIVVQTKGLGDIIVAKLDSNGTWLWAKSTGTAIAYDEARGIALDDDGDVYITGYINGTVEFGNTTLESNGFDGYFAKLNGSNGNWIYAINYGGFDVDVGWDLVVDSDENVYVTGFYQNNTVFGPHILQGGNPSSNEKFFIAKYNSTAPEPWLWAYTAVGEDLSVGFQLVLDDQDNIYVVGYNTGTVRWHQNSFSSTATGNWNGFLLKYNTSGSFHWGKAVGTNTCFGTSCGVYFNNVVIDSQQRIVVGGNQIGDVAIDGGHQGIGDWDIAVSRWQSDGTHDWWAVTGSSRDDRVQALAVNPQDRPVVGGWLGGSAQFGSYLLSNVTGDSDFFIAQLYTDGTWDWAVKMGGSGDDTTHALLGLSDGSYIAGGYFSGTVDFGDMPHSATDEDIFVWKFKWDSDGDGVHDFTDNCDHANNSDQANHDADELGDACETDDDNDGKHDAIDDCQYGVLNWNSSDLALDYDEDGCRDIDEDLDDDSDGVLDVDDACPLGMKEWSSNNATDMDGDGCRDSDEDLDDDDDLILDEDDNCPTMVNNGQENWDGDSFGDVCDLDDDGDFINDDVDDCPLNSTGWVSDSQNDNDGDGCKDDVEDYDDDNDGLLDVDDLCPSGETGWTSSYETDLDGDGCRNDSEDSDNDDDGLINQFDSCKTGELNWTRDGTTDVDNDGCRDDGEDDNDDNDDYLDIEDDCPKVQGSAYLGGLRGCPDFDEDGWGDTADAFPQDSSQWEDGDQDGYGDNPAPATNPDSCPLVAGTSSIDRLGCTDSDLDGYSDPDENWLPEDGADALPDDPTQWIDDDEDGYGDDPFGNNGDMCPGFKGYSMHDRMGCPDSDGDGYSDSGSFGGPTWKVADGADAFPTTPSQWNDSDGDGFGDNWANELWNETRNNSWPGQWFLNAQKVDECPLHSGFAGEYPGCPAGMLGFVLPDDEEDEIIETTSSGESNTFLYVAAGSGGVIVLVLIFVVINLLKSGAKPKKKPNRNSAESEEMVESMDQTSSFENQMGSEAEVEQVEQHPRTVPSWQQLPGGEYLPMDEHGTNWYRDNDGVNWYQNADETWTEYL